MKKQILILLLIASSTFAHTMEHEAIGFLSYFPFDLFLPTWLSLSQTSNKSDLISNLRTDKDDFENQLSFNRIEKLNGISTMLYGFDTDSIQTNPYKFLQYCYYYAHWEGDVGMMQLNDLDIPLLEECHKTQIDGYSALGAAIIAKNASGKQKYTFIQELINHGFNPTQKDIELAELMLYDAIPAQQKETIILFLCDHKENYVSQLLPEIKTQIIQYIIQLFKDNFYLLPETPSNDV